MPKDNGRQPIKKSKDFSIRRNEIAAALPVAVESLAQEVFR
jgi:hypothetical protein